MKVDINDANHVISHDASASRKLYVNELFGRLKVSLSEAGFSPSKNGYSIQDTICDDCFVICKDGDFWSVSYFERGLRLRPAFFFDLEDAIRFFLTKIDVSGSVNFESKINI